MSVTKSHKTFALSGVGLMAVGSLIACMASGVVSSIGDASLLMGIAISTWGFSGWRP